LPFGVICEIRANRAMVHAIKRALHIFIAYERMRKVIYTYLFSRGAQCQNGEL